MATVTIRPDGVESSTGFDVSGATLVSRINDEDDGTIATQTSVTCEATFTLANDSSYSGATINSIRLSVTGRTAGKASSCQATCKILNASDTDLQSTTHTFGTTLSQEDGAAYTTSLTPTIVDGLKIVIDPDTAGLSIAEVFLVVNYTAAAAATTPFVGMKSGKYKIINGKIRI